METKKRGGTREGSGRPKGEPHTIISFRVKTKKAIELKNQIKKLIENENSKTKTL